MIKACLKNGVKRFIYCSTVDVVIGVDDDIVDGNEENTMSPSEFLFPGYPETKYKAECLVLKANNIPTQNGMNFCFKDENLIKISVSSKQGYYSYFSRICIRLIMSRVI